MFAICAWCWWSEHGHKVASATPVAVCRRKDSPPTSLVPPPLIFGEVFEIDLVALTGEFAVGVGQPVGWIEGFARLNADAAADGGHERVAAPDGVDHRFDVLRGDELLDGIRGFFAE